MTNPVTTNVNSVNFKYLFDIKSVNVSTNAMESNIKYEAKYAYTLAPPNFI